MALKSTITFNRHGQVSIPLKFRRRLGIEDGTQATLEERNGTLILKPITATYVSSMRGKFAKLGTSTADLEQRHRTDRAREKG